MSVKNLPVPYKYAILTALGLSLLFGLKTYLSLYYWNELEYFKWDRHIWLYVVNYTFWAILTPVVYYLAKRFPLKRGATTGTKVKAIGASMLLATFHEAVTNVIFYTPLHLSGYMTFSQKNMDFLIGGFPSAFTDRMVEYWIVYAILIAFHNQKRFQQKQVELAETETQLANAQLNALRLQLNPHFLFNTLNTISSLMVIDRKTGQGIVSKLGNLLRRVLDTNQRNVVSLQEELDFIQDYLSIEQTRFQDRLNTKYEVDREVLQAQIPSLLLQPLVENAIKHGFATQPDQGHIIVRVTRKAQQIQLEVEDDGSGSNKSESQLFNSGIGLKNVRDRLALLYGKNYDLNIQTAPGQGFLIRLIIPFERIQEG